MPPFPLSAGGIVSASQSLRVMKAVLFIWCPAPGQLPLELRGPVSACRLHVHSTPAEALTVTEPQEHPAYPHHPTTQRGHKTSSVLNPWAAKLQILFLL